MQPDHELATEFETTARHVDDEWRTMQRQIAEIHTAIMELRQHITPALEAISKGGIMSMLMGRKKP